MQRGRTAHRQKESVIMSISLQKIEWHGWQNCYLLTNGHVELIVTADVGPRIMSFSFPQGENILNVNEAQAGRTQDADWNIYGGHRLWHSPELRPRTYFPDNRPVTVEQHGDAVHFIAPIEESNGVQKTVILQLAPDAPAVTVTHRIQNVGAWEIELAVWALSVMAAGGTAVVPLPPRGSHSTQLLPTSSLILWAYTHLTDPRWTLGKEYVLLRQQSGDVLPQKFGASVPDGWAAYVRNGQMFLKQFEPVNGATYPDMGSMVEVFTNHWMLELETLAPLNKLAPQSTAEHVERWSLHPNVPTPQNDDDVNATILPIVRAAR